MRQVDTTHQILQSSQEGHDSAVVPTQPQLYETSTKSSASTPTYYIQADYGTLQADSNYFFLLDTTPGSVYTETDNCKQIVFDSIFASHAREEHASRTSMFKSNEMQPVSDRPIPRIEQASNGWTFFVFAISIAIISLYSNNHRFVFGDILSSSVDSRSMERVLRSNNMTRAWILMPMMVIYALPLALIAFYISQDLGLCLPYKFTGLNYIVLFLGAISALSLRNGLVSALGNIFENDYTVQIYNKSTFIYQFLSGITLTPLSLLLFCQKTRSSALLKITLFIAAIFFIIRFLRGIIIIVNTSKSNQPYLLYYIAALELVPLIILWKLLIA